MNYSWAKYSLRKLTRSSLVLNEKSSLSLFAIVSDLSPEPAPHMLWAALCTFSWNVVGAPRLRLGTQLGFTSLHSLYLLYTKLGEKANFGECYEVEKIWGSRNGRGVSRREATKRKNWFGVLCFQAAPPIRHFAQLFPKTYPRICAYFTNLKKFQETYWFLLFCMV